MIQGKILSYGDDLNEVFTIRRKVFVEEKGTTENTEFDQYDKDAIHVIVYEQKSASQNNNTVDKVPVATGRVVYDGERCNIDHIAVLKEYRNKMYGDFAVRMLINRAFIAGINEITLTASIDVIDFFKKIGFQVIKEESTSYENKKYQMVIKMKDVITKCGR